MARRLVFLLLWLGSAWPAAAAVAPGTSTAQSPRAIFATPGAKQVTLKVCNLGGCTMVTKTVTVLDPKPVIDQALIDGASFVAGQLVRLSGAAHGRPPLTYTWKVVSSGPEVDLSGAAPWLNTSAMAAGAYLISLVVQNADGMASSTPVPVSVAVDAGMGFYTLTPCRVLDTRTTTALANNAPLVVSGLASCGVPPSAHAIAANVTVAAATTPGNVVLYPGNYPRPPVSTINFAAGQTRANNAIIGLASDATGTIAAAATLGASGTVHLIVDVDGYFQ
jgi:PKD repeat protein